MPVTERTLGVLVAGGAGERLGLGLPKARVTVGGITLLERALRTLAPVCDDLVVAAPASVALPLPPGVSARGGDAPRRVEDLGGARGPLAGMLAGLTSSPFGRSLVLGVDFPCMETAFLAALLERLPERPPERPGDFQALVPAPGGIAQPMAAAYAPAAVPILAARHANGEAAPSRALRSLAVQLLDDAAIARLPGGPDCLFNLNTAADRSEAERRLKARAGSR